MGHRDIRQADHGVLAAAVRRLIDEARAAAPGTPIVLMSSLAEGADQLAARVALDVGAELWVPLPLEILEYRKDFSESAAQQFDELLARAHLVVPLGLAPGNTASGVQQQGPQRDAQYAWASEWILRRCHVLIALWDGEGPARKGGTACTVKLRLDGLSSDSDPASTRKSDLDVTEAGPVWQVVAPRRGSSGQEPAGRIVRKYPESSDDDPDAGEGVMHSIRQMGAFNAELAGANARLQTADTLVDAGALKELPQAMRAAAERYALVDALALAHRDQTRVAVPWVFGAGFVSLLCLALFAHVFPGNPWWLCGYIVTFLVGFVVLQVARQRAHEQQHVDYRALAEALRVQFFWELAGSREWAANSYLRIHRSELDWVREALRAWTAGREDAELGTADVRRWEMVRRNWVRGQHRWLVERSRELRWALTVCRRGSSGFLWSGFATAVAMLVLLVLGVAGSDGGHVPAYIHSLIVTSAMLMLLGGMLRAYAETMGFETEANRYRLMAPVFERADRRLAALLDAGNQEEAVRLVEELGREALVENAEWLLARRKRRLEPLTSG